MSTEPEEIEAEEEETEEEEEEREERPIPPAPNAAQAAAGVGKARGGKRNPRKPGKPVQAPDHEPWTQKEGDLMWMEMVQHLKTVGKSPYDIDIAIYQLDPPPQMKIGNTLNGGACAGTTSESAGDSLMRIIDDHYHCPRTRTPVRYDLRFTWKATGRQFGRGSVYRPDPQEIAAVRHAAQYRSPPPPWNPGVGAPQGQPAPSPPAQAAAPPTQMPGANYPPQYGYPPPVYGYGAPPQDPQTLALLQQNAAMLGQFQALMEFVKAQGLQPPAGIAAPPPAPPMAQQPQAPPNWYAQPPPWMHPPEPPPSRAQQAREMVQSIREMKAIRDEIDGVFSDLRGGEEPEATGLAAPAPVEPPQPGEKLPFDVMPIPEANFLGKPVNYARNKETGGPDWTGIAMANPQLAEKAMDLVGNFMKAMVKAAGANMDETVAAPGVASPQLGAAAANGAGGGWPGV